MFFPLATNGKLSSYEFCKDGSILVFMDLVSRAAIRCLNIGWMVLPAGNAACLQPS
jgi:hypothetical protein